MRRIAIAFAAIISAFLSAPTTAARSTQPRHLTFEDRVRAQEAIERVYYSHQIGTTKPFEEAVGREVLKRKVRLYLQESVALQEFWKNPITSETLQREMERIARGTRFPGRLQEVYAALEDNPLLIQETLARATLADRLIRNFFSFDARLHGAARVEAEVLRRQLLDGQIDPFTDGLHRSVVAGRRLEQMRQQISSSPTLPGNGIQDGESPVFEMELEQYQAWRGSAPIQVGEPSPVVEDRDAFTVRVVLEDHSESARIAVYQIPKIGWEAWWAGTQGQFDEASAAVVASPVYQLPSPVLRHALSCEPEDEWQNGILDDIPKPRESHTAVWTGSEMIIWGGDWAPFVLQTGARYDPLTDTWRATSEVNAPVGRVGHTAVWTGSEMIVWGGSIPYPVVDVNTGGRYDPVADTWTSTPITGAPLARAGHTAVWSGTEMIIWGGGESTGARYDPANNRWTGISLVGAPSTRYNNTAVWTGSEMIVWGGGDNQGFPVTGGRYDPRNDSWTTMSNVRAPSGRMGHSAVWTGSLMIIWGGHSGNPSYPDSTGARYDPATDFWLQTNAFRAPEARYGHIAVMLNGLMIVWGGAGAGLLNSGARYDVGGDSWEPTSDINAPSPRFRHTAVSSGDLMLIWGGSQPTVNSGGRYDPVSDSWTPTSRLGAPSSREYFGSIWTGTQMVIWGGLHISPYLGDGARYDPMTDAWTGVSMSGAPAPRMSPTAVWTGETMVIWSGYNGALLTSGGRYDPVLDRWAGTSTTGTPAGRFGSGVWTGEVMVIWGGGDLTTALNTGGRYDPRADEWLPLSLTGAPSPRVQHSMIWTGTKVVAWGGQTGGSSPTILNTGGRYDPWTDSWLSTSLTDAPSIRSRHTAIWSGESMIVWGGGTGRVTYGDGARYDPSTDEWAPMSDINAPSAREQHGAVWTGDFMIVWGGRAGSTFSEVGGRYDLHSDRWTSISTIGQPLPRTGHAALWTGTHLIVWGGNGSDSGGRYAAALPPDGDGDGVRVCDGDCDDSDPLIHPGATEFCDSLDNNCDGMIDDLFYATVCGSCSTGYPGICSEGTLSCVGGREICNECFVQSQEVCDGLDGDCDGVLPSDETDADADGFMICAGDNCIAVYNPGQENSDGRADGGDACDMSVTTPLVGSGLCTNSPPTIQWSTENYDLFRVYVSWDQSFKSARTYSSGDTWLKMPAWTPPAKKWVRGCDHAAPSLYIRVCGKVAGTTTKECSDAVVLNVQ